jgi:uncharacterized membrane protein
MKKILIAILVLIFLFGCTQRYVIPQNKTVVDYESDRQECIETSKKPGGIFLIGPLIIIFPIFFAYLAIKAANNAERANQCMMDRGYEKEAR